MNHKTLKLAFVAILGAALLAFAAAVPSQAQNLMPGFQLGGDKTLSPEEKERNEANEKAAKEAQKSIKAPKVSNDPWGDVRASDAPAKPAKSKKVQ